MRSEALILLLVLACIHYSRGYEARGSCRAQLSKMISFKKRIFMQNQSNTIPTGGLAVPGVPLVRDLDRERLVARLSVAISGAATQQAFSKSCSLFNEEVKTRGYSVPGFRPGATLAPQYLFQIFGEDKVKMLCGALLAKEIQIECEKSGMQFVGRGRVLDFNVATFTAGQSHIVEVECDLWPEISYAGSGYKGLTVTVTKNVEDLQKFEKVKQSIRERYKILNQTPAGVKASMGDVILADMKGYELNNDGSKGAALPEVANGNNVEIVLEQGKFMAGMVESLVGGAAGETKLVTVTFPARAKGPGAALSGKKAVFEVLIKEVKTKSLPEWNEALADRVRTGMTLNELNEEVRKAIESESSSTAEGSRNDALAAALLEIAQIKKLPDSLLEENTQSRFQNMLMDFKEQGSTDEQLQDMSSPENYERYKKLSAASVEKVVKLGLVFRDISERERVAVEAREIQEQLDMLQAQAKQKGENPNSIDTESARDEIENVLLRKKVFDFLASHAHITYVDPVPTA